MGNPTMIVIEEEIPPWTTTDTLALLSLITLPIATAPILFAGAMPLVPIAAGSIGVQGVVAVPVITAAAKAFFASWVVAVSASVKLSKRS